MELRSNSALRAELEGQAFEAHLVFDPTMQGLCPGSFSNGARLVALPGQPGKSFYDCALRATLLDDSSGAGHAEEHHLPVVMYQGAFVVMTFVLELFFLRDREEIAFLRTLDFDSGRKINRTSVVSWVLWHFWAIAFVNNVAAPPVWGFSSRSASGGM